MEYTEGAAEETDSQSMCTSSINLLDKGTSYVDEHMSLEFISAHYELAQRSPLAGATEASDSRPLRKHTNIRGFLLKTLGFRGCAGI